MTPFPTDWPNSATTRSAVGLPTTAHASRVRAVGSTRSKSAPHARPARSLRDEACAQVAVMAEQLEDEAHEEREGA